MVLEVSVSPDIGLRNMERRTSSPIGIPSAKLASLRAIDQQAIAENQLSDEQQQQAASPKSAPQHDGSPGIDMYLEGLPEGSPAFSHVYTELTMKMKELDDELETKMRIDDHSVEVEENDREDKKTPAADAHGSPQRSPQRVRKQTKTLTFNCETTNNTKGSTLFRRRTKSASLHRTTPVKDNYNQYKMHPTPSLVRKERASKGNVNSSKFVFHIIPKYKFLTETVTVSHEDLVKEQEIEQQLQSPKSIFGSLDEKTYSG